MPVSHFISAAPASPAPGGPPTPAETMSARCSPPPPGGTPRHPPPPRSAAARPAAGRQQQRVVRQQRVVVEPHALLAPQDLAYPPPELRVHLVRGEELRRTDDQPLALERAGQVLLRQRRPLVRQPRLIAHHAELPRKAPEIGRAHV